MATLPIFDKTGAEVGKYEIDPSEIAATINKQLLHDVVVMYQANKRQGSHRSRSRGEISGSTRKLYRQKGTGNARMGSRRSGVRRGGGHIFAKRPRDYSYRLPRKAVQAATRMAIAGKLQDNEVIVIDELSVSEPKTSAVAGILKALKLHDVSTLVTTESYDANVYKSVRNMADVTICPASDLNAYEVLRPRRMLVTKAALDAIKDRAAGKPAGGNGAAAEDNESTAG